MIYFKGLILTLLSSSHPIPEFFYREGIIQNTKRSGQYGKGMVPCLRTNSPSFLFPANLGVVRLFLMESGYAMYKFLCEGVSPEEGCDHWFQSLLSAVTVAVPTIR